jgi:hypothetical protein
MDRCYWKDWKMRRWCRWSFLKIEKSWKLRLGFPVYVYGYVYGDLHYEAGSK